MRAPLAWLRNHEPLVAPWGVAMAFVGTSGAVALAHGHWVTPLVLWPPLAAWAGALVYARYRGAPRATAATRRALRQHMRAACPARTQLWLQPVDSQYHYVVGHNGWRCSVVRTSDEDRRALGDLERGYGQDVVTALHRSYVLPRWGGDLECYTDATVAQRDPATGAVTLGSTYAERTGKAQRLARRVGERFVTEGEALDLLRALRGPHVYSRQEGSMPS